ncbi:carboxylate/amino acid/amine transporter [compost metagenome]
MTFGTVLRLVAVMALWASCFPLITVGLGFAPHLAFAATRASLAGVGLFVVAFLLGRPVPRGAITWLLIAVAGFGTTTLGFIGMFHAAEFVSPGIATIIANAQPLLAALLGRIVLDERLNSAGELGFAVGFAGIVAIAWPGILSNEMPEFDLGIGYILLAATGVASGNVVMKRLTGGVDAAMAMAFQFLIGALPLVVLSLLTEDVSAIAWSGEFLAVTAILALLVTALPYWLWFATLESTSLNRANAFAFLTSLIGIGIGAAFFAERLDWIQFIGVGAVLVGVVLVQLDVPKNST